MASRPGHAVSRSLNGIRTSIAVLRIAPPLSPARDINRTPVYTPTARSCKRLNSTSLISARDRGFESQEPTSPKVSCIGHIKRKSPQREKPSKKVGADTADKAIGNLSKLKKLLLRRQIKNKHTSGSYDAKLGGVYMEEGSIVAKSESFMLDEVPKKESEINIWSRRFGGH